MTSMLIAVTLLAASAAAAVAQPPEVKTSPVVVIADEAPPTRHVSFADLNLASADGKRTLGQRVRSAVDDVCSEALGPLPILYAKQACFRETWQDTGPQLTNAIQRARGLTGSGLTGAAVITVHAPR